MIDVGSLYKIEADDKVFIDTNILIFLFAPSFVNSHQYQINKYSEIFKKLVSSKCELYVNELVISEFVNRCMRIDFERNFNSNGDKDYKKDYRTSVAFDTTMKIVLKQLNKFLSLAKQVDDDFINFNVISSITANIKSDFNDLVIADTVNKKSLKLLTDDGDFKNDLGINTEWYLTS